MTEEEKEEFEKKWKAAQSAGQTVKAQGAQLICIPGDTPYRIRKWWQSIHTGDVFEGPARATEIASVEGKTIAETVPDYLHSPYDAIKVSPNPITIPSPSNFDAPNAGTIDPIRNKFFSFFDDRRMGNYAANGGTPHIELRRQMGGQYWKKQNPTPGKEQVYKTIDADGKPAGITWETLESWGVHVSHPLAGQYKYYKPKATTNGQHEQLIEIIVPSDYGTMLEIPGSKWKTTMALDVETEDMFELVLKHGWGGPEGPLGHDSMTWLTEYVGVDAANYIQAWTDQYDQSFFDGAFILNKPFVESAYQEALGEKIGISDPVKVQAHYNFYLAPYENIIKDNEIVPAGSEANLLPNLYGIMVDAKNEDKENYLFKHADNWQYLHPYNSVWTSTITSPEEALQQHYEGAKAKWGSFKVPRIYGDPSKGPHIDTHNEYLNKFAMRLKGGSTNKGGTAAGFKWSSYPKRLNAKRYSTTGISAYQLKDFMDEADRIKKFFPMHADIEIPASNKGEFGNILHEAGMFDQFMQLMMALIYPDPGGPHTTTPGTASTIKTAIVKKDSTITDNPQNPGDVDLSKQQDSLYYEPLIALYLTKLLEQSSKQSSMPDMDTVSSPSFLAFLNATDLLTSSPNANMANYHGLGSGIETKNSSQYQRNHIVFGKESVPVNWVSNIKWAINKNKINKFIEQKTRSVSDIYDGKYAHSEVLFYEIVKFRTEPGSEIGAANASFVQNIFLPNAPGLEVLKYVDTQVKFGEEYYYQVYAHTMVVGTQYQMALRPSFATIKDTPPAGPEYTADVNKHLLTYKFAPSVHLMRVPYYNTYVTMQDAVQFYKSTNSAGTPVKLRSYNPHKLERTPIWDKPPVFPDIVFHPLYGEKNKILINSNFNVGEYDLNPFFIDEVEKDNLDMIRRNQKKLTGPITFRGDDFCGSIEVLRTDKKPLAYSDFKDSKIATLGGTSHFGKIIEQEPNKEYYYTARAIDKHGNYSNPSPIYQVIIIAKVSEAPYTIINMFFVDETEEKKPVKRKNLMKYIRIQPSFDQSFLNDSKITNDNEFKEGGAELFKDTCLTAGPSLGSYIGKLGISTVFGKKFKFRFTSKKTGKKFDLNLQIQNPGFTSVDNKTTKGEQDNYSSGKC